MGENAAQHAFHIAVQDGFARVKGKGRYGGGRAAPHAFEPLPFFARLREFSAEFVHDLLRGGMQVARAAVIAQPCPQGQHGVLRCGGQIAHSGQFADEAQEIIAHGGGLRLLQHDFRQPNGIRVAHLPREVVPTVFALPCH